MWIWWIRWIWRFFVNLVISTNFVNFVIWWFRRIWWFLYFLWIFILANLMIFVNIVIFVNLLVFIANFVIFVNLKILANLMIFVNLIIFVKIPNYNFVIVFFFIFHDFYTEYLNSKRRHLATICGKIETIIDLSLLDVESELLWIFVISVNCVISCLL